MREQQRLYHGTPFNIPIGGVVEPKEVVPGDSRGKVAYAGKYKAMSEGYATYENTEVLGKNHPAYKPHPAYVNGPQGQLFGNVYNVEPVNKEEAPVTEDAHEQGFRGGLRVVSQAQFIPHNFEYPHNPSQEEE